MGSALERRLVELGHDLPEAAAPAANYLPYVTSGNLVFVSGQLPVRHGKIVYVGRLGDDVGIDQGKAAAALCALNLIAQAKAAASGYRCAIVQPKWEIVRWGALLSDVWSSWGMTCPKPRPRPPTTCLM